MLARAARPSARRGRLTPRAGLCRQERHRALCEQVREADYLERLQFIPSPLSPQVLLGEILVSGDGASWVVSLRRETGGTGWVAL